MVQQFWFTGFCVLRSVSAPNKACSGFLGVCGFDEHFSGFEFFLLSGIFPARPKSANANRLAVLFETLLRKDKRIIQALCVL
jgi:hypothetical protein